MGEKYQEYIHLLGEAIINYQLVEHNLRYILAAIDAGDFKINLADSYVKIKGLGQLINEIEKIDLEKKLNFFSPKSYKILKELARDRNKYCHSSVLDFAYLKDFENSDAFINQLNKLKIDHDNLLSLQIQTEKIRIDTLKGYILKAK